MIERVKRAAAVTAASPGFHAADSWLEEYEEGRRRDRYVRRQAALAAGDASRRERDVDFDYNEREHAPSRVHLLEER